MPAQKTDFLHVSNHSRMTPMLSVRIALRFLVPISILLLFSGCKSEKQRETELKVSRLERVWSAGAIDSLKGMHRRALLSALGDPEKENWYGPEYGTLVYDSLQLKLDSTSRAKRQSIMITIRDNHVAEVDTLY
jgi:hypothetical protein